MRLKIEISSNLKIINFLDATLNLSNNFYKPFNKSNTTPTYINVSSNHPASIVKQIPNAINIRIYRLLSSKNISNNNNKEFYNEVEYNSGYKNELRYLEANRLHISRVNNIGNNDHKNRWNNGTNNDINIDNKMSKNINQNRHRNIIWFNPPFCKISNINVGKYFLGLIGI